MKNLNSNTTLVKVKFSKHLYFQRQIVNSNTTLVKVKFKKIYGKTNWGTIQIQHLLKLNGFAIEEDRTSNYSNTTLVKVKLPLRDGDTDRFDEFKYNTC